LQNLSCAEARQGRSELRQVSNPGEAAAVPSRNTSGTLRSRKTPGSCSSKGRLYPEVPCPHADNDRIAAIRTN
jgi:hypothetical protein